MTSPYPYSPYSKMNLIKSQLRGFKKKEKEKNWSCRLTSTFQFAASHQGNAAF